MLGSPMNGHKLPTKVVRLISTYLVDTLLMGVDEVDVKDLLQYATEAWSEHTGGGALPGMYRNTIGLMLGTAKKKPPIMIPGLSASPSLVG